MDKHDAYLLKLLSAAIREQQPPDPDFAPVDWEKLFMEASAHEVHTLIYPILKMMAVAVQLPQPLMDRWEKITLVAARQQVQNMYEAYRILEIFREADIPVIVLKGIFIRELYPQAELRTMSDIDLLVKPTDLEHAGKLLETLGYRRKEHGGPVELYVYSLKVEMHYYLLDAESFGALDDFEQRVWGNSCPCTIGGQAVLTLSVEDNLIYLLLHMIKHFLSSGFGLRQLCDVVLFVERYGLEIDSGYFWSTLQAMGYETFAVTVFEICRQFLGLNIPVALSYGQEKIDQELVLLILQEVMCSGVYGRKNKAGPFAGRVAYRLHTAEHMKPRNKLGSLLTFISGVLFPGIQGLSDRYSYARQYPFLLPAAWVHRAWFSVYSGGYSCRDLVNILRKAPAMGVKRSQLLERLKI